MREERGAARIWRLYCLTTGNVRTHEGEPQWIICKSACALSLVISNSNLETVLPGCTARGYGAAWNLKETLRIISPPPSVGSEESLPVVALGFLGHTMTTRSGENTTCIYRREAVAQAGDKTSSTVPTKVRRETMR